MQKSTEKRVVSFFRFAQSQINIEQQNGVQLAILSVPPIIQNGQAARRLAAERMCPRYTVSLQYE